MNKVRILVLGDMGRSPRMRNHCVSFANCGWEVFFTGFLKSELPSTVTSNSIIHIDPISEGPEVFCRQKRNKFCLIIKVFFALISLLFHLLHCEWTNILLIQNPPAVPTFLVAWIVCKMRGIKLVIDWHNYGHTLMESNVDQAGFLARLYKRIEVKFSQKRLNATNFCVSKAFKHDLLLKWNINSQVLYDLPLNVTTEKDLQKIHELFVKLGKQYPKFKGHSESDYNTTILTEKTNDIDNSYKLLTDRPVLLVTSCSWTIDDDFETLFKALDIYNAEIIEGRKLPEIFCVITGKGPMKDYFERVIAEQEWEHVSVVMPWLETDDYPVMLSAADLGICLHKSTSGLDLPMKIVDMFSVGLPVLALNYKCLHELVHDNHNGRLFSSHEGLHKHLVEIMSSYDGKNDDHPDLSQYRRNIVKEFEERVWQSQWEDVFLPVVTDLVVERKHLD